MTTARNVEQSLFPDFQPDKPVGAILPSVFQGTNAELIRAVAPYYLTGKVMDCTYGDGKWWDLYRPEDFTAHDLHKVDGVDFTNLPEADDTYDAVCFDPPYIPAGGYATSTVREFHDGFGLRQHTRQDLAQMMALGLGECTRVTSGYVLAKCTDYVSSGQFWLGHIEMIDAAALHGLACHDLIVHHTGSGPGGNNIFVPKRARRHHSYLLVFVKSPSQKGAVMTWSLWVVVAVAYVVFVLALAQFCKQASNPPPEWDDTFDYGQSDVEP